MTSAGARRLAGLAAAHRGLGDLITQEARRTAPDLALVTALKRRKLLIKDQLAALTRRSGRSSESLSA